MGSQSWVNALLSQFVFSLNAPLPSHPSESLLVYSAAHSLSSSFSSDLFPEYNKGFRPTKSRINVIPLILPNVASIIASGLITVIGYYTPFLIVGCILLVIGCGLISTLDPKCFGYQLVAGVRSDMGIQVTLLAIVSLFSAIAGKEAGRMKKEKRQTTIVATRSSTRVTQGHGINTDPKVVPNGLTWDPKIS